MSQSKIANHNEIKTIAYIDASNSTIYYNLGYLYELGKNLNVYYFTSKSVFATIAYPHNIHTKFTFFNLIFHLRNIVKSRKIGNIIRGLEYPLDIIILIVYIYKIRPDIIHFNWIVFPSLDLLLIKFLKTIGLPVIYTVHNAKPHDKENLYISTYNKIFYSVKYIISLTEHVKNEVHRHYYVDKEKIFVIPHGDHEFVIKQADRYKVSDEIKLNKLYRDDFILSFFGLIRPYKGLNYLINAMPYIIKKFPNCKLLIFGMAGKNDKNEYFKLIDDLNIKTHVVCDFRYIPLNDLVAYLKQTDIVILPYIAASQSGNIPMLSKMGIPVITTSVGGLPEQIKESYNGFLVPPRDEKAIANAVCKILIDPTLLKNMKRTSVKYAEEYFAWKNIARKTIKVYESAQRRNDRK